jgi:hypothetical protein
MANLRKVFILLVGLSVFTISCKRDAEPLPPFIGTWDLRKLVVKDCVDPAENDEYLCPGGGCDIIVFSSQKVRLDGTAYDYTVMGEIIHVNLSPSIILVIQWKIVISTLTLIIKDSVADGGCTFEYTYLKT